MFAIVANGNGGQDPAGVGVWLTDAEFQGALWVGTFDVPTFPALATDAPFSEVEFCAIDAAIASGHNPFYLPPVEVIPTPVPVSDVILPKND